ncbi:MAG: chorismate mutase [Gemmatimonadaceae bacterium]
MDSEHGSNFEMTRVRAVRGATVVSADETRLVCDAVRELLNEMTRRNGIATDDIVSVLFTMTPDLKSEFPARAAHALDGWHEIPMLCTIEIDVPGALAKCIRVLMHAYSPLSRSEIRHAYLGDARQLRPDLLEGAGGWSL